MLTTWSHVHHSCTTLPHSSTRRSSLHTSVPRLSHTTQQQQQQQALNRSNHAIRDHLLLLLTPTNQDAIDLQSILYDLKEIADPDLVSFAVFLCVVFSQSDLQVNPI